MITIISLAQVYPCLRTPYLTFDSMTPFFYTLDKSNNNENLCSANLILLSQSSQNLPRRRISKIITWNPNLCFSCKKTQKKCMLLGFYAGRLAITWRENRIPCNPFQYSSRTQIPRNGFSKLAELSSWNPRLLSSSAFTDSPTPIPVN